MFENISTESSLSRFLTKTKSGERNRQWLDQLRSTFVQVMTSQSDSLRGGIIAEVLERAVMAQERMTEEKVFKKKAGQGQIFHFFVSFAVYVVNKL